jgi:hypothetical protein
MIVMLAKFKGDTIMTPEVTTETTTKPVADPAILALAKKPEPPKKKVAKTNGEAKTAEAKPNGKTAKSNGKEAKSTKGGMTTREAAKLLKTTPKALRRALRDMDKYDDGVYTRYLLGKADINALTKVLSA